jgi:hypothetical protein
MEVPTLEEFSQDKDVLEVEALDRLMTITTLSWDQLYTCVYLEPSTFEAKVLLPLQGKTINIENRTEPYIQYYRKWNQQMQDVHRMVCQYPLTFLIADRICTQVQRDQKYLASIISYLDMSIDDNLRYLQDQTGVSIPRLQSILLESKTSDLDFDQEVLVSFQQRQVTNLKARQILERFRSIISVEKNPSHARLLVESYLSID